ncbi:MAG: hypothetical protein ACRD43_00660 [Pyrinomonadaceae bacterium]
MWIYGRWLTLKEETPQKKKAEQKSQGKYNYFDKAHKISYAKKAV